MPCESAVPSLWEFSVSLYGAPGVERACLILQDRYGADVNMVLFCLWHGPIPRAELERAVTSARALREGTVEPLRRLRRALSKQGDEAGLREAVKRAELEAERLEQARLEKAFPAAASGGLEAARANLADYALVIGAQDGFLEAAGPILDAYASRQR
jgi:uncharacterized protein (TIGR02444 family)